MSSKTPVRVVFDGSNNATGLAEFQSGEFIPLTHGGLGASLSLGTAGQVLKVNSGATALEFSSDAGIGLSDLSVGSEASASGNGAIAYNNSTGVFTYTPPVLSGLTGDTDDVSEGSTNLYFTNARADARISNNIIDEDNFSTDSATRAPSQQSVKAYIATQIATKDNTDEITEGSSNLYFTNARADARITAALIDEDNMASDSATRLPSQQSVKAYVDAQDANIASDTLTFTNKTFDVEATGNSISNIDVADLKSGVLDTDISSVSASDDTLASAKAIKTYVDAQIATKDNTDEITEGSSNLYFTNARARGAISAGGDLSYNSTTGVMSFTERTDAEVRGLVSVTDSGGDGSLAYNNSTGVITYTGPSASEVRAHISGGTGVTITSGEIAIGQDVGTSDNVQFNNATIAGNLTVSGTTTTVSSTNTLITDKLVELANGQTGSPSGDIGHVFERGDSDNAFIGFDESEDKFIVGTGTFTGASTGNLTITKGTLLANVEGNVTGNVTGDVTGNADTATTLETARTIGGVSFNGSANINLPGVNTTGNQNTTGSAATLTTARTIAGQSFDGSANITIGLTDIGISDGTADQVLTTDGAGNFTFEDAQGLRRFSASTINVAPSSEGNFDLTKTNNEGASETPFDSTATDAFGVAIGILFDCMEPIGAEGTTTDLGAFS